MNQWTPPNRREVLRRLRTLGFTGPHPGTRHEYMGFGRRKLTIPTNSEYSVRELRMILRQAETIIGRSITAEEWNRL